MAFAEYVCKSYELTGDCCFDDGAGRDKVQMHLQSELQRTIRNVTRKSLGQDFIFITRVGQSDPDPFCLVVLAQLTELSKLLFFNKQILNYSLGFSVLVSSIAHVRLPLPLAFYGSLRTHKCFWVLVLTQRGSLLLFEI